MSDMSWTKSQQMAIEAGEGNFLVSAGAGSGKTAVLTERVYRLVRDHEENPAKGASISNILVLTFTNKAAAEMKNKVRKKILSDPLTKHLAGEVEGSSIMTFDAFAHQLVSRYHYAIGVKEKIDVVDESVFEVEKNRILDEILAERYAAKDPEVLSFLKAYCVKDDEKLRQLALDTLDLSERESDSDSFYDEFEERYYGSNHVDFLIRTLESLVKERLEDIRKRTSDYEDSDIADDDRAFLDPIIDVKDFDALLKKLSENPKYPRKKSRKKGDPETGDGYLHASLNDEYKGACGLVSGLGDSATMRKRYLATRPYVMVGVRIAKELASRLLKRKKEASMYSFADIAAFARQITLLPIEGAEIKRKYRYVMIDEYQDTNDLQESFIKALSGGKNVFVVGDIKQSIYGFRNANTELIASKSEAYALHKGGELITLAENFRSRQEILGDINFIFLPIMSKRLGGVDYARGQSLLYGNKSYDLRSGHPEGIEVYSYKQDGTFSDEEAEARLIAADILQKVSSGYKLLRTKKGEKPCLSPAGWGDFAILPRTKSSFDTYRRVFLEAGIPLVVTGKGDASGLDVSLVYRQFISLFAHIDEEGYEAKNRRSYLSIKRSFLYEEKDPDLYADLKSGSYLRSDLFNDIREERKNLGNISLRALSEWVIDHFRFLERLLVVADVKDNYAQLRKFVDLSASLDRFGTSPAEFDKYFDDVENYEVEMPLESASVNPDSVSLMSIHASKGLEFKVVYVPEESKRFNIKDSIGLFLDDGGYGVAVPLFDGSDNVRTVLHSLITEKKRNEIESESLRLYYVALTRAEEKLILLRKESKDGIDNPTYSANCFRGFLDMSGFGKPVEKAVVPLTKISQGTVETKAVSLTFGSVNEAGIPATKVRPSKESLEPSNEGALEYGSRLHRYLELADFKTKDVSWIADESDRKKIEKVLSLPLFAHLEEAEVMHEYAYYDEKNDVNGSIDLLILYKDKAVIVDYKSRSIDDPAYERQVEAYASYLRAVTGLPVEKYLLSINEARLRALQ